MNISAPFIERPVATALLTIAITLAGVVAFRLLPVSPLPQVDFPTISVSGALPGASPETMASSVATPLERQFGHIASVTEMTSTSTLGTTSITLQFDLNRDINAAAGDVQAAINAARAYLPANIPNNPTYRKVNPADSPIFIIALTSDVLSRGAMYDAASTIMAQKLSQVQGVGQVIVGGSTLPGVRIELNPTKLNKYNIGLEEVRTALASANSNRPKGFFSDRERSYEIGANDQIFNASDYAPIIVAYRNGAPVRIRDVGEALDSVQDIRNAGFSSGKPSVLVIVFRQPGANIINTVDQLRAAMPQLEAAIPRTINLTVAMDQTVTIRASVNDVEITLILSVALVVLVVFAFLRSPRTTFIPSVAVPVSLIATFGVMYLLDYSLDNLSLMALTISTGFVVDDAIVVIENITRYLEQGMSAFDAALKGSAEIGFTVLSISLSLIAVFIPILLMGGIVGRLMHEFAVTLSIAIFLSMLVSLTTTPTLCAYLLKSDQQHGRLYRASERAFDRVSGLYAKTLNVALRFAPVTLLVLIGTIILNVFLFIHVPKGFFPEQDNGRLQGAVQADQAISFQAMEQRLLQIIQILNLDPGIDNVIGFTGAGGGSATTNTARLFISLKPLDQRVATAQQIINRLRPKLAVVPGARLYLQASQDVRIGGRQSNALYQYTLTGQNLNDLVRAGPVMLQKLQTLHELRDVSSDQQNAGLESNVEYDRGTAARFQISANLLDNTLYDAFGQREVSTMYTALNQYYVVMETAQAWTETPLSLNDIWVKSPAGAIVPLSTLAHFSGDVTPLAVNHQGLFPSVTISYNLAPGVSLGQAVDAITAAANQVHLPSGIQPIFSGTAEAYQQSLGNEPVLIAAALTTVYIVLGVLYESLVHPVTILSTLPSAGVGALLALLLLHVDLTIIAMIGIILLIGIVKKNGILLVDFAIAAERNEGKSSRDAIYEACLLRFRPILMTTMAAMLGALPLAVGTGTGSELRRPLGITIIGGLIVSQLLTLYTTPVVYLYMDRLRSREERHT